MQLSPAEAWSFGAAPEAAPIKGAASAIWGMFIHSNWDARLGFLGFVLNGPGMHRWHHADQQEAYGTNFATKLSLWDWLFGTAFSPDPRERKAERYGLGYAGFPQGYFGQVLRAFGRGPFDHEAATGPAREEAG